MVDKSSRVSFHSSVHHQMIIYSEHVAADASALVELFPLITELVSYDLTRVLYNHLAGVYPTTTHQTPAVYTRAVHSRSFLSVMLQMSKPHGHG